MDGVGELATGGLNHPLQILHTKWASMIKAPLGLAKS